MSTKRELQGDDGDISQPSPKRPKKQSRARATTRHQHQNSFIDPTWGQKYVFANLEDATTIPYGEDSDFEDDADAMAYLLSVRKEAQDIPHLLVAPKVQIGPELPPALQHDCDKGETEADQVDIDGVSVDYCTDVRGHYDDGAYIALPDEDFRSLDRDVEHDSDSDDDEEELHKAYFASTIDQYHRLRTMLHSTPPPDAAKRLLSSQITYAAPFGRRSNTTRIWGDTLRNTHPHPLQLALMSKDTVIRIIRVLMDGKFLRSAGTLTERTSRWLWGLLARLPDPGELNHQEVAWVRDLGRRAVLLGSTLPEMAALQEDLANGEQLGDEGVEDAGNDEDSSPLDPGEAEDAESPGEEEDTPQEAHEQDPKQEQEQEQDHHQQQQDYDREDGEILGSTVDESDVAMDLDSGSEDGEEKELLEAAKRGLLAKLKYTSPGPAEEHGQSDTAQRDAAMRKRINTRATLNMILTIAGEYYGQRDLLEFREPFAGL